LGLFCLNSRRKILRATFKTIRSATQFLTICFLIWLPRHVGRCSAWLRIFWLPQSHQN